MEVKKMTYSKPEVAVLGDATRLILGGKTIENPDSASLTVFQVPDCELDD